MALADAPKAARETVGHAAGGQTKGGDMVEWSDLRVRLLGCGIARLTNAHARRPIALATLAASCLLAACATTSMPSVEQGENTGMSGYVACLDGAARRMDDGRSDVAALAAAIKGVCAARFPEPSKPPATMSAAARQKYEERIQARQMELSTMVVQDLRGQP